MAQSTVKGSKAKNSIDVDTHSFVPKLVYKERQLIVGDEVEESILFQSTPPSTEKVIFEKVRLLYIVEHFPRMLREFSNLKYIQISQVARQPIVFAALLHEIQNTNKIKYLSCEDIFGVEFSPRENKSYVHQIDLLSDPRQFKLWQVNVDDVINLKIIKWQSWNSLMNVVPSFHQLEFLILELFDGISEYSKALVKTEKYEHALRIRLNSVRNSTWKDTLSFATSALRNHATLILVKINGFSNLTDCERDKCELYLRQECGLDSSPVDLELILYPGMPSILLEKL